MHIPGALPRPVGTPKQGETPPESQTPLCVNRLHPSNPSILQHHLDAVGMARALREDSRDDALGLQAGRLVLLLDYSHPLAGADFGSRGQGHGVWVLLAVAVEGGGRAAVQSGVLAAVQGGDESPAVQKG